MCPLASGSPCPCHRSVSSLPLIKLLHEQSRTSLFLPVSCSLSAFTHKTGCQPQQPGTQKGPSCSRGLRSHLPPLTQPTGHWQQENTHARNIQTRATSALQPLSSLLAPRGEERPWIFLSCLLFAELTPVSFNNLFFFPTTSPSGASLLPALLSAPAECQLVLPQPASCQPSSGRAAGSTRFSFLCRKRCHVAESTPDTRCPGCSLRQRGMSCSVRFALNNLWEREPCLPLPAHPAQGSTFGISLSTLK